MTKSKTFWAVLTVISLAAAAASGYSIYARLAEQFSGDNAEAAQEPVPQAKEVLETKAEPAPAANGRDEKTPRPADPQPAAKTAAAEPPKQKAVRTPFEFKSASARTVALSGTFNKWKETPMAKKNGVWKTEVYLLPGNYRYHFVMDGKKTGESVAVVNEPGTTVRK